MILFLVDGGKRKGYGHIVRVVTLANAFMNRGIPIHLLCVDRETEEGVYKIQKFDYISVAEKNNFLQRILDISPTVLISDRIEPLSYKEVTELRKKRIFVIECDRGNRESWADEVINGFETILYGAHGKQYKLVGRNYFILRPEFIDAKNNKTNKSWITDPTVFICLGGFDPAELTEPILNILCEIPDYHKAKIYVVLGFAGEKELYIRSKYHILQKLYIYANINARMMSELMSISHLAIVPFGTLFIEALFLELPVFMVNPTKAHEEYAKKVLNVPFSGVGKTFGYAHYVDWKLFSEEMRLLRQKPHRLDIMSDSAKGLIDGMGVHRVVEYIINHIYSSYTNV